MTNFFYLTMRGKTADIAHPPSAAAKLSRKRLAQCFVKALECLSWLWGFGAFSPALLVCHLRHESAKVVKKTF